MSACSMLTFTNVAQAAWDNLKQIGTNYGVPITSDAGSVSKDGFTVTWNYNAAAQTLAIQCTESPLLVSCSEINSQINNHIEGILENHGIAVTRIIPS
jgi:hypothetical protein